MRGIHQPPVSDAGFWCFLVHLCAPEQTIENQWSCRWFEVPWCPCNVIVIWQRWNPQNWTVLQLINVTVIFTVNLFIFILTHLQNPPQQREGRQGDCSPRQWGHWNLRSASPVTIKAVTMTIFPFLWPHIISVKKYNTALNLGYLIWSLSLHPMH